MSSVKRLVYAVIHFLREQSQMDTFTPDEQESLEGKHIFIYFYLYIYIHIYVCVYVYNTYITQVLNSFMHNITESN